MHGAIQRDGRWWHRRPDGSWLVWDEPSSAWVAAAAPPPPPPMPGSDQVPVARGAASLGAWDPWARQEMKGVREAQPYLPVERQKKALFRPARRPSRPVMGAIAALLAVAVTGALFLGGFLGGSGPDGGEPAAASVSNRSRPTLSKAKFTRKADRLCVAAANQIKALGIPSTPDEFVRYLKSAIRVTDRWIGQVNDLGIPKKGRKTFLRLIALNRKASRLAARMIDDVRQRDGADLATNFTRLEALGNEALVLERSYGLKRCAAVSV